MTIRARTQAMITFDGLLEPSNFCQFVRDLAPSMDLDIEIVHVDRDCAEVSVAGHDDLIDAFEMTAGLGPNDCVIDRVTRRCCESAAVSAT